MFHQITTLLLVLLMLKANLSGATPKRDLASCEPYNTFTAPKTYKCEATDVCCKKGEVYYLYKCSPPITSSTPAIMTENNFADPKETGGRANCTDTYPGVNEKVVALSTGWYNNMQLCFRQIKITALKNGKSTTAMVIDECDSNAGCDEDHAYQRPCRNNIVDASPSVWEALDLNSGEENITWSLLNY